VINAVLPASFVIARSQHPAATAGPWFLGCFFDERTGLLFEKKKQKLSSILRLDSGDGSGNHQNRRYRLILRAGALPA
jgi:hypothetical protein